MKTNSFLYRLLVAFSDNSPTFRPKSPSIDTHRRRFLTAFSDAAPAFQERSDLSRNSRADHLGPTSLHGFERALNSIGTRLKSREIVQSSRWPDAHSAIQIMARSNEFALSTSEPSFRFSWQAQQGIDIQIAALLLAPEDRVHSESDLVFDNNVSSHDHSVMLTPSTAMTSDLDAWVGDERFSVNLKRVSSDHSKIVFIAFIHHRNPRSTASVGSSSINMAEETTGKELAIMKLSNRLDDRFAIIGEIFRVARNAWHFKAGDDESALDFLDLIQGNQG